MYLLPSYIIHSQINNKIIDYSWDDSNVESCLNYDYANDVIERIENISIRAKKCTMYRLL